MLFRRRKSLPVAADTARKAVPAIDRAYRDRCLQADLRSQALERALKVAQPGEAPALTVSRAQSFYDFVKSA